ncbi:MAG: hypothetical protein HY912_03045 [Desulfomonile tiedjei]|uniref:Uncharacterized protein n=1 Tax=Desulfomonile tiedjei TaxID=2358 RepID=A0A9D6UYY6_9BACT|nr:hypothetical protein [Desulfomonile tiedjei]
MRQIKIAEAANAANLRLTWAEDRFEDFAELLQRGFMLKARARSSIRDVLCGQFGISHEYLDQRINTIFLDGKPVDDVDSATIGGGSKLALSAAMPGFVGAALRKGGFYAPMRQVITHVEGTESVPGGDELFVLKLFNLVVKELGPLFLDSGIWLDRRDLESFFNSRPAEFWSGCLQCLMEVDELEVDSLHKGKWLIESPLVYLRIHVVTGDKQ